MASHIQNLLKQLSCYEKTIKPKIKEFTKVIVLIYLSYHFSKNL